MLFISEYNKLLSYHSANLSINERLSIKNKWEEDLAGITVKSKHNARLIEYLLTMADLNGVVCQTKRDISNECLIALEDVTKILLKMKSVKLISLKKGLIFINEIYLKEGR